MRDLKADLEICSKATPGPWRTEEQVSYVSVYSDAVRHVNCMHNREGKVLVYINRLEVLDEDGRFKHWDVEQQDIKDAEFIAQAREGWPYAIEQALAERRKVMEKDVIMGAMQQAYADQKKRIEFAMEIIRKTGETAQKVRSFDAETVLQVLSSLEEVLENG